MGQKPSSHHHPKPSSNNNFNKSKLPLSWILRNGHHHNTTTHYPNPQQPIKFQYKTKRKPTSRTINNIQTLNNYNNNNNKIYNVKNTNLSEVTKCKIVKTQNTNVAPLPQYQNRTKSEPSLTQIQKNDTKKHRHRKQQKIVKNRSQWQDLVYKDDEDDDVPQFGYEIQDVDAFLAKATIEKPANIPVVLAFPSVLYQTRIGGYQAEISLPLGMVVNAVFKNQHWLYVQTPHAEEGYVSYAACLPLGIIPPPEDDKEAPCWEISTDVFPKPSGNMTDTEKLSSKSDYGGGSTRSRRSRNALSSCGEKSFDKLYLRAAASAKNRGIRQTLLVIVCDYQADCKNGLNVAKGDVVVLIDAQVKGWFWVKNKDGAEGFIPAAVAGHGFL